MLRACTTVVILVKDSARGPRREFCLKTYPRDCYLQHDARSPHGPGQAFHRSFLSNAPTPAAGGGTRRGISRTSRRMTRAARSCAKIRGAASVEDGPGFPQRGRTS